MDWESLAELLSEANHGEEEEKFNKRLEMLGGLADFANMHDWHTPHAQSNPSRCDSCARLMKGCEEGGVSRCMRPRSSWIRASSAASL